MDVSVSGIVALGTEMSQARTAEAVQIAVLKKAMEVQSQGSLQLIQAAAQVVGNNPPHLGNAIDTTA